jgi:hypothetical protein
VLVAYFFGVDFTYYLLLLPLLLLLLCCVDSAYVCMAFGGLGVQLMLI